MQHRNIGESAKRRRRRWRKSAAWCGLAVAILYRRIIGVICGWRDSGYAALKRSMAQQRSCLCSNIGGASACSAARHQRNRIGGPLAQP
jgi:hypothetical protein